MSMIPGIGNSLLNKGNEKESIDRIKRFLCMMDSMTEDELEGKAPMNPTRIKRIARGSGTSVEEVNALLEEHKKMAKVFNQFSKTNMGKGNDLTNLTRNPGQMMGKMQKMMDPRMLQQLGGAGNIMNMMKEMSKMEGMGDLMKTFNKKK